MINIHGAFNARTLSVQDLCKTFILSDSYNKLAAPSHSILVGPRGSGKTTLMRMLQVEALNAWGGSAAESYRQEISYSGVFIPTDRFWKKQFEKLTEDLRGEESSVHLAVLKSSFTYHVLERFCSVLEFRVNHAKKSSSLFKSAVLSRVDEVEMVEELSELWKVNPKIKSIRSLESAISSKKKDVSNYVNEYILYGTDIDRPEIVVGEIMNVLDPTVRIVNSYLSEKGVKWAFLFDELELAPEDVIQPLVDAMRGGSDDIILKLSLSPYHKNVVITHSPNSSMGGHDYSVVRLTGINHKLGLEFSKKICSNVFVKNGFEGDILEYFENPKEMNVVDEFVELAGRDATFEKYLSSNGIVPIDIPSYTEKNKGPTVRKIKFVAQIRNYYYKSPRKRPPNLYVGFNNLCKSMEYNPRMLIGLMNMLVPILSNKKQILIPDQIEALRRMYESHKALLNTIAVDENPIDANTIYDFVNLIGEKFKSEILGDEFKSEPRGSLIFKNKANEQLVDIIGAALNSGALVLDSSGAASYYDSVDVKDARCRLSFIFSHQFSLLLSKPREIDLTSLINYKLVLNQNEPESIAVKEKSILKAKSKSKVVRKQSDDEGADGQMKLL
tara:strand:+ start:3650 stop:5488 length:1839 start_codon:yes stop_codon:yes gene_type:complete